MKVMQRLRQSALGLLAIAGLAAVGNAAIAQTTDGFTIFGGVDSEYRLSYYIDNNERRSPDARYYLRVAGRKLISRDVLEIQISYPEKFEENGGHFTNANIELRDGTGRGGEAIPVDEIVINPDENLIEIYPEEPIPANSSFVIAVFDVRNPNRYGNHYFVLDVLYQGGLLREFAGIWPIEASAELDGDN
ncbi:MAG: DUF2808 domain-containing protein [Cyanobacteria bacterium J06639_14]